MEYSLDGLLELIEATYAAGYVRGRTDEMREGPAETEVIGKRAEALARQTPQYVALRIVAEDK